LPGFCFIYIDIADFEIRCNMYSIKLPGRKHLLRQFFRARTRTSGWKGAWSNMIEIALNNVEKYYGANHVLKGATFEINEGERVALLGENGAGKSTLFKILTGSEGYDNGERILRKGASIGFLEQIPEFPVGYTVREVLYSAFQEVLAIHNEMSYLEKLMANSATGEILEKYGRLQELFESQNGYSIEEQISRVCQGLKIVQGWCDQEFNSLSGGEKTRVKLAQLILQSPNILLLDEPTNHLDLSSIEWLENFLNDYQGTIFLISHDRYFLDKLVNRVLELVHGKIDNYQGNFTNYVREKEERYQNQLNRYEAEQKKIEQLEAAAKRMHEWAKMADNPALHRQAFSIEKRVERLAKTEKPPVVKGMENRFVESAFSGQAVIMTQRVSKAYNQKIVLHGCDLSVRKGERVAVFGDNGSGKSTFLKILIGEITPDSGLVKVGTSIRYGYLPQVVSFQEPAATVLELLRKELRESEYQVRRCLAKFNFRNEDIFKTVGKLSGGEKTRLKLCLLMQRELNLLLLDEPTNHLDIASRQWLEEALTQFQGTMLFVSHDRYFVNRFATRIIELNQGLIDDFSGDYECYKLKKAEVLIKKSTRTQWGKEPSKASPKELSTIKPLDLRKKLETDILALEAKLNLMDEQIQLSSNDCERLMVLAKEREAIESKINDLYEQWVLTEG
jgi:ATP-binding cassette, subfamily F, member 3